MDFQERKPNKKCIINHIYNTHHKYNKLAIGDPRSRMQHLMKLLLDDKYVYIFGMVNDSLIFQDIFLGPFDSVKLFKCISIYVGDGFNILNQHITLTNA